MSQTATPTEPGWRPDPSGRYEWRYWDGGWTNRVANSAPTATSDAAVTPSDVPVEQAPVATTAPDPAPAAPELPVDNAASAESRATTIARHRRPRPVR